MKIAPWSKKDTDIIGATGRNDMSFQIRGAQNLQAIDSSEVYQCCANAGFNWRDGDLFGEALTALKEAGFTIVNLETGEFYADNQ